MTHILLSHPGGIGMTSEMRERGFPHGTVVKNPPANAGDRGSIPGTGRSQCHRVTKPMSHTLLSPRATTTEACAPRAHDLQQEKPP